MQDVPPKPDQSVIPHLVVDGAKTAIDLYARAFGAEPIFQQEMPDGSGRLIHATLGIGNSIIMLVDAFPEHGSLGPKAIGGTPVSLHLTVADCDAAVARATEAGCTVVMEPADMFWGDRYAQIEDPFGHRWSLGSHVRDVTPEDMERAMKEMMPGG